MEKECKYCNNIISYDDARKYGAHLTNCEKNPEKIKRDEKSKTSKPYTLKCNNCGNEYTLSLTMSKFKSNRFKKNCTRSCANKRNHSVKTKEKISKSLSTGITLYDKRCSNCDKDFSSRYKNQKFCSKKCSNPFNNPKVGRKGGIESNKIQNKRSKNEIEFANLCLQNFKSVRTNENIFNGWDADVIIEDIKVAILWNGVWHYKKITESHSLKQVQNRDKTKVKEIKKSGYYPYIIKDMGSESYEKVKTEWEIFNIWLNNKNINII